MNKKLTALITGGTGQDSRYLTEILLQKGYRVIGLKRRTSIITTDRVDRFYSHPNFSLEYFDLNDAGRIWQLMMLYHPDEIYNLAAQSHVRVSFDIPEHTVEGIVMGTLRLLNAMKTVVPEARFYQASSSEMFGDNPVIPKKGYNEESKMTPASPYACAKLFAHNLIRNYRESYKLHLSSGILFNHESPARGETFVTRKITMAAANIKLGKQEKLELGNLNAMRDWGYARDYCFAMWLMLQQDKPDDYIIATGETHSVKEFVEVVFDYAELDYKKYVVINPKYYRPHEVPKLLGDSTKAREKLNWKPKISFEQLAKMMYDSDYELAKKE